MRIRYFDKQERVTALGPSVRAAIWVQGCHLSCPGCIVPESWSEDSGQECEVADLVRWVLDCYSVEGLTLSGGEPMLQAEALNELIDGVRRVRDIGVVCYTGYNIEYLVYRGNAHQRELLKRIDLLIDGPYVERLHQPLLWRGSSNQRLNCLSDRYRATLLEMDDCPAPLQLISHPDGTFQFIGVPPEPGWRQKLESELSSRGILLKGGLPEEPLPPDGVK